MSLPPLPEPAVQPSSLITRDGVWGNLYTESQMLADRAAVVEACAKVAEQYEEGSGGHIAIRELLKGATP